MSSTATNRPALVLSCILALGAAGCLEEAESPIEPHLGVVGGSRAQAHAFQVYTQNVYLGGDTGPLFTLDFSDFPALLAATNQFWADVQASDIPARAIEFVNEIESQKPQVVALQEAFRFIHVSAAGPTVLDLLASVEAEIAVRGLPYETAIIQEGTSSDLPLAIDFSTGNILEAFSFTDRVVILRRTDTEVVDMASALYEARIPLGPLDVVRGWARLSVRHRGIVYHVVATHLETQGARYFHDLQAVELRNSVIADLEGVTLIVGDLNSDANASEGDDSWTPTYGDLIADGFTDVWASAPGNRRAAGLTCCSDPSLLGDSEYDQRLDFVLARSTLNRDRGKSDGNRIHRGWLRADIVGEEEGDRTAGGLWPSDHAGIAASLRIPGS